jgi:hypothetical protein
MAAMASPPLPPGGSPKMPPMAAGRAVVDHSESEGGASPAARDIGVPLRQPKYEFKTRMKRRMNLSDSESDSAVVGRTAAEMVAHRSVETLKLRQGHVSDSDTVTFRSYAVFQHGKHKIVERSVGYTSDSDLVLYKDECHVADSSDQGGTSDAAARSGTSDHNRFVRRHVDVTAACVLNPHARPRSPHADADHPVPKGGWEKKMAKMTKYPGVKNPKNRKVKNRLCNDHMATLDGRDIFLLADGGASEDEPSRQREALFGPVPATIRHLLHKSEDEQRRVMEELGVVDSALCSLANADPHTNGQLPDKESGAFRYSQLSTRLKSELSHAIATTDFMPGFIADLEDRFVRLIAAGPGKRETVQCHDGYGRLICHGVAAYYFLSSQSETTREGDRVTVVATPKKQVPLPDQTLLSYVQAPPPPPKAQTKTAHKRAMAAAALEQQEMGYGEGGADGAAALRKKKFKKRVLMQRA